MKEGPIRAEETQLSTLSISYEDRAIVEAKDAADIPEEIPCVSLDESDAKIWLRAEAPRLTSLPDGDRSRYDVHTCSIGDRRLIPESAASSKRPN